MAELNFALSDEQRLLRDSCEGFVQAEYSLAQRAESLEHPANAVELWQKLAEQGYFHLAVSEALGGLAQADAALENLALTAEVMGTALMALPMANGAIYPARLLSGLVEAGVSQSVCEGLIEPLLSGGGPIYVCPVVATQENGVHVGNGAVEFAAALSRSETLGGEAISFSVESLVTMTASPSGSDSHGLSGSLLLLVPDGESCQLISLPLDDPRLSRHHYRLLDDSWAMTVSGHDIDVCAGVRVSAAAAAAALTDAEAATGLVDCAMALGAMTRMVDDSRDYLLLRRQFGRPLAEFQALQHRLADMAVAREMARAHLHRGLSVSRQSPLNFLRAERACRVQTAKSASLIGRGAIQLHGAIALSEEHHIAHYYRSLVVFIQERRGLQAALTFCRNALRDTVTNQHAIL
ncbi:hypothetical protein HCU74_03055 [Spongiibacter sp. KMU-166]|uniref:Acyl-CoA dehydrogenase n=1 Tax=Spongiibacter thalassae TaxID=2721624 RepID=A0ABX1GDB0_9GAMM|nr:acyl-CoA dehydrogenase family protein [Spongiibacter thalassae]NKI16392.1 hypothetical protein [Spongiibacter thalassae]